MKSIIFVALLGINTFALADDLPLGHPTVKDALEAAGTQSEGNAAPLPNQGTVVSTIHSKGYTYIEVKQDEKNVWLAAPKVELADGSQIRYGNGITMANFYSASLDREFPEIFFIERVESVQQ